MKRFGWGAALAVLVAAGSAQAAGWEWHDDVAHGLHAYFPDPPATRAGSSTWGGRRRAAWFADVDNSQGRFWTVAVHIESDPPDPQAALDAAVRAAVANLGEGPTVSVAEVPVGDGPGREIVATIACKGGARCMYRSRIAFRHGYLYQAGVVYRLDGDRAAAETFVTSLKLSAPAAEK